MTEGLAFLGVILPLYSRDTWQYLPAASTKRSMVKATSLLAFADLYTDAAARRHLRRQPAGGVSRSQLPRPAAGRDRCGRSRQAADDFLDAAPVFGTAAQWWPYACSNWPVVTTEEKPDFSAPGAAPIVVVGTTRDPATPYESAVELAATARVRCAAQPRG